MSFSASLGAARDVATLAGWAGLARRLLDLSEHAAVLRPLGWKGRRAEWIALACFHGGVFTERSGRVCLGCHHEMLGRAVRELVAQGVAIEEKPPRIRRHRRHLPDPRSPDL